VFDKALNLVLCRFRLVVRGRHAGITLLAFPFISGVIMSVVSNYDDRAKMLGLFILLPVSALVATECASGQGLVPRQSALKGLRQSSALADILFGASVLAVPTGVYMLFAMTIGAGSVPSISSILSAWCVSLAIYFSAIRFMKPL